MRLWCFCSQMNLEMAINLTMYHLLPGTQWCPHGREASTARNTGSGAGHAALPLSYFSVTQSSSWHCEVTSRVTLKVQALWQAERSFLVFLWHIQHPRNPFISIKYCSREGTSGDGWSSSQRESCLCPWRDADSKGSVTMAALCLWELPLFRWNRCSGKAFASDHSVQMCYWVTWARGSLARDSPFPSRELGVKKLGYIFIYIHIT